ncbi:MAG: Prokaryotic metallothionein, partial [Thermocrispum sp.]
MATCDVCGNDYWLTFEVRTRSGDVHVFDSIECAAQRIAPQCE